MGAAVTSCKHVIYRVIYKSNSRIHLSEARQYICGQENQNNALKEAIMLHIAGGNCFVVSLVVLSNAAHQYWLSYFLYC